MHIAICDDNTADRKQLERLLARESDKRIHTTGNLYVDSYGHAESLLKNPMQYDAFFIDIRSTEDANSMDIVYSLTSLGSTAPVILCHPQDEAEVQKYGDRILFLDKPVKVPELAAILDKALAIKESAEPKIELREEKGTYYVSPSDILYARKQNRYILVTLKNGQEVLHSSSMRSFIAEIESYPEFFTANSNTVLNADHIRIIKLFTITMEDHTKFKAFGRFLAYAKKYVREHG